VPDARSDPVRPRDPTFPYFSKYDCEERRDTKVPAGACQVCRERDERRAMRRFTAALITVLLPLCLAAAEPSAGGTAKQSSARGD
jgi:hypothetical protein